MSNRRLRFDGWVLDPESGDLERAGTRIRLQEQSVQVLRELIAHAGSVVTREQLIALLWPKGVVDFDTGLNTVIRKLRSALGDTSETPRYIETLPRRGYRFIAVLDPGPEAPSAVSPTAPVSTASRVSPAPAPPSHPEPPARPETALAAPQPMPSSREPAPRGEATAPAATTTPPVRRLRLQALALIAALAVAALLTGAYVLWRARSGASVTSVSVEAPSRPGLPAKVAPTSAGAFSPPPHSIAVLPFVNISGDKEQEYFSDGLTEELLTSLTQIDGLQVAARTSSFSFREHPDIADVAHKLNVATVLEGSVRRSGHTVRVTAQLMNAVTGFHFWSKTYDRNLGDVLKLQTEIATAVASAMKVTLLGDVAAKVELGGTRNPAAFDAYLRAGKAARKNDRAAIAAYSEAIRLDPNYALAFAARSNALANYASGAPERVRESFDQAQQDALKAIGLAPDLAVGHVALAVYFESGSLDFARANDEYERAEALAPGNALVLLRYSNFAVAMGRIEAGIFAARRAAELDPLNHDAHRLLGDALGVAHQYHKAIAAYQDSLALDPDDPNAIAGRAFVYYALGNLQSAQASCESKPYWVPCQVYLAMIYHKLGRPADADAMLAKVRASQGDAAAFQYAEIYAQWGNTPKALEWLETALRLRDPGLEYLKTDPLLDPLRNEPRFQAIDRELKFPA